MGRLIILVMIALSSLTELEAQISTGDAKVPSAVSPDPGAKPLTREDELTQMREEKAAKLTPPPKPALEKYAQKFDQKGNSSIEDMNFWGFHPRVDWIARGSGMALGTRYWKPEVLGPIDLMGAAFYSWKKYQYYDLQVGLIPNTGKRIPARSFETEDIDQLGDVKRESFSRFKLYASGRFRDRTDESYFGTGPNSSPDVVHYGIKDTLVEMATGYQITKRVGFTVKGGLLQNTLAPGRSDPQLESRFPDQSIPGKEAPPNYFRTHASILFDFRDDPNVPHEGFMVAFGWEKYDNVDTVDLFNFNRFGIDSRAYFPLGSHQQVLAVRGVAVDSDPAPNSRVPFFIQPSLGGGESLRGYDAFRFQGDKSLLVQGEYRWEASPRFELAFFVDSGTVANQGSRLSFHEMNSDAGFGFRVKSSRSTLMRIDSAWGSEGYRLQFRFEAVY
jgi:Omp85 superfamily domain